MWRHRFILALVATALAAGCNQEPSGPDAPSAGMPPNAVGAASAGFGGITIVLDAGPTSGLDVRFATMGRKLKDFVLDDDADATLPSSRTFGRLKAGAYTVQQPPTAGLPSLRITCISDAHGGSGTSNNTPDLPNRRMTIQLEREETVVCTYRVGPWQAGDVVTYVQSQWGDPTSAAGVTLAVNYGSVYSGGGILEVGISGATGFSIVFNLDDAVQSYLPASQSLGPLTADYINPTLTESGVAGGETTALKLNVDFSEAGVTLGANEVPLGDLTICAFSLLPAVNGLTARQFLGIANTLLGGGSGIINISQSVGVANFLNASFAGGAPSTFAQDNLVTGACP